MKEKILRTIIFTICLFIFVITVKNHLNVYQYNQQVNLEEKSVSYILDTIIGNPNIVDGSTIEEENIINYEMIIEIPKIALKKGILNKYDKDNNIDKNVTILQPSVYPNEDGNIYIAAHSGNGHKSFFNDLVKLELYDEVFLYYQNQKYSYRVKEIKGIDKNGTISLISNDENMLYLITCSQQNKGKYLIISLNKVKEIEEK